MRVHIYASYWIGFAVGFMLGVVVGFLIWLMPVSGSIHLPAVTMGDTRVNR